MTATPLKDLVRKTNGRVNCQAHYRTDMELYGMADFWTRATSFGDCEDYAIAKAIALLDEGFPIEQMRLATCWDEAHNYHAVLVVTVEDGDWVMDNRFFYISRLEQTGYKLHLIQVPGTDVWEYATTAPELVSHP